MRPESTPPTDRQQVVSEFIQFDVVADADAGIERHALHDRALFPTRPGSLLREKRDSIRDDGIFDVDFAIEGLYCGLVRAG